MALLGLDIGGTKTALVLGDGRDGSTHSRREFATRPERGFDEWLAEVVATAQPLLESAPQALSVAVGGPLDDEMGILLNPPHLAPWGRVDLAKRLVGAFPKLPVYLMHDAQAGAFAEYSYGAGALHGARRLVFLTFATGFGCGVVMDGRVMPFPGEVGHWRVAEIGPEMFGKKGSLEGLASGGGIALQARESGAFGPNPDVKLLAREARRGNETAKTILHRAAIQVGRQCARLIDFLAPDMIVLGTIAVQAGDLLMETIQATAREEALPHLARKCRIVSSALEDRLGDVASLSAALIAGRGGDPSLGPSALAQAVELSELTERMCGDRTLMESVDRAALLVVEALSRGGKVMTCGNGGSAADALHLAEELIGRYRGDRQALAGVSLNADATALTCIANDFGFMDIFARQVEGLGRPGDVLVSFTTSGESENVLRAMLRARERGISNIVVTGKGGGRAALQADCAIVVPHRSTARIQEIHTWVLHAICEAAESYFSPK
ncbi:MAG: ROK family protein [Sumerlaeia bacterium]